MRNVRARAHRGAGCIYPRAKRHCWCSALTCRHRQIGCGAGHPDVRAQGSRPHHPVAAGGRSRRTAGLPPGDMREKVDPFTSNLRRCTTGWTCASSSARWKAARSKSHPAFMRGRTLSNACVISMKNTTSMQMKMFLTRLGENTHDRHRRPKPADLPNGQPSGLAEARLLAGIEGIATSPSPRRTSFVTNWSGASSKPATAARPREDKK